MPTMRPSSRSRSLPHMRTFLRVFGLLLAVAGLAALAIGLYGVFHNLPTANDFGSDSTSKVGKNVPLIGGGIAGIVIGMIIFTFVGQLMSKSGTTRAVDLGAIASQPGGRSYGNMYLFVAILELALGGVFLAIGLSGNGGLLFTGAILAVVGIIFVVVYLRIRRPERRPSSSNRPACRRPRPSPGSPRPACTSTNSRCWESTSRSTRRAGRRTPSTSGRWSRSSC